MPQLSWTKTFDVTGYYNFPRVFKCRTRPDAFKASALINSVCVAIAIEVRHATGTVLWASMLTCFFSYIIVYTVLYRAWDFGGGLMADTDNEGHTVVPVARVTESTIHF